MESYILEADLQKDIFKVLKSAKKNIYVINVSVF